MRIRLGCELGYEFPAPTPMIVMLNVHYSRAANLEQPDHLITNPSVPIESYRDSFGNWCCRLVAPAGRFTLGTDAVIRDDGSADPVDAGRDPAPGAGSAGGDAAVPAGQPLLRDRSAVR